MLSNACNWLRENGKSEESLNWLERGLRQWPDDLHLRWGWVLSLHHSGYPEKALRNLEKLIEENGDRPLLLRELGACLVSCKRIDEAIDAFKRLLAKEPENGKVLQQYLALLQKQGNSQEAWHILKDQKNLKSDTRLKLKRYCY